MVGTITDDVLALFSACGFEVRTDNPQFAILGSTDSAGILVDSVIEHFACKAVTQFTVRDIMASMPAPAAARTSVDNVQDVLAALDHLEVVRMAAAGVERRRAAPAPAAINVTEMALNWYDQSVLDDELTRDNFHMFALKLAEGVELAGRCRAQGGDTKQEALTDGQIDRILAMVPLYTDDDEHSKRRRWARAIEESVTRLAATTQATPAGWRIEKDEDAAHGKRIRIANPLEGFATLRADGDDPRETVLFRYFDQLAATAQASTAQAEHMPGDWQVEFDAYSAPGTIRLNSPKWGGCFLGAPKRGDSKLPALVYHLLSEMLAATSSTDAQAAAEVRDAWISVDERLPAVGELVLVYSPPTKHDHPGEVNIGFDCIDPNDDDHASWLSHNEHYEHFCCVAKPEGSIGPSAEAPYTHWMPLPAAPAAIRSAGDTGGAS